MGATLRAHFLLALLVSVLGGCATSARRPSIDIEQATTLREQKPRVVVTTDPELDDSNSLIRHLRHLIRPNWPDIRALSPGQGGVGVGYGAYVRATAENAPYFSAEWTSANVSSRGALGAHYRVWGDGKQMVPGDRFDYFGLPDQTDAELRAKGYVVWLAPRPKGEFLGEGDTFTFFNLIGNGLGAHRGETPGGDAGFVTICPAQPPGQSPQPNFTPAAQNDFAARMHWSVTPTYAGANHEPRVSIRGSNRLSARPGETVRLEGIASDPDGDVVAVRWWRWKAVDTYPGDVSFSDPSGLVTTLRVPDDALPGQVLQLVLEATDAGKPALTRYQRIVVAAK